MKTQIAKLRELQSLDDGIRACETQLARLRGKRDRIDTETAGRRKALENQTEMSTTCRLALKSKEIDLGIVEGRIKKLQAQLNQAKSNKEFTALKYEIRVLNEKKSALEDDILGIMERLDRGDAERDRLRLEVEERQA